MADVTKNQSGPKPARKTRVAANVLASPAADAADRPAPDAPATGTFADTAAVEALTSAATAARGPVEAKPAPVEAKPAAPQRAAERTAERGEVDSAPAHDVKPAGTDKTADTTTTDTTNTTTDQTGAKTMTDTVNNTMNNAASTAQSATDAAQNATATAQNAAQQTAEQLRGAMNQAGERGKAVMERGQRVAEEMADISRGNLEAVVASSKTAAKYVETLAQGAADYSRRSFEEASAALRSFAEVKSPADLFRLQSEYARTAFDAAIAETARVSETVVKMGGEIAEPIASRYAVAAERLKSVTA